MNIKWQRVNRKVHLWGSIICAIPILIVLVTGILLLLKKESTWIQPSTIKGQGHIPTLSFEKILSSSRTASEVAINDWSDIKRLDVRPRKGVIKLQTKDNWEIQMDHQTGEVLQVAYRRSDIIEAIHDGTFSHDNAKLGIFLPSAIMLLILSLTGIYLFIKTIQAKRKSKTRKLQAIKKQINIPNTSP